MRYVKSDIKFDNEILTNGTAITYRYKKGCLKGSEKKDKCNYIIQRWSWITNCRIFIYEKSKAIMVKCRRL